jgi:aldehyde dehydrogenase (NAD+)
MEREKIHALVAGQRAYFESGATLPVEGRVRALRQLRDAIRAHEDGIARALEQDLGKSRYESYLCEVGLTYSELGFLIAHTKKFSRPRRVPTPLALFPARSAVCPTPLGVNLIMSPWNYPFLLTVEPLADAIAAGNTAILKPSAGSPHTTKVIETIVAACFPPEYVAVVSGGRAENQSLLQEKFDHIFFTGSQTVGREVMKSAAQTLTPVTLELGGKSPCLVDCTADLRLAARRIVFGKVLNCGQTCVAPDFVYCDRAVKDDLLEEIQKQVTLQLGARPLDNEHYGHIVNRKHFDRLCALVNPEKVVFGGETQPERLRIAPTVMDEVTWDDPVMGEEIFGPILPVLTFENLGEAVRTLNARPHPLALYLFSKSRENIRFVTRRCQFGGGCVNDTVVHLATSHMGFGGVGDSGMGAYHGKTGFDTFSHHKSILENRSRPDLPLRYQPYGEGREKWLRRFLR